MMIAADHPARGALAAGSRPFAMGDRATCSTGWSLALSRPGVNGVLGTPDILEDLLLLGALDDKVVVGSMNRGGLAGTVFELDDRFTGYDAQAIADAGFEGGKMLTRIDPNDPATVATLESCADAVSDLARHGLMAMVEPFISHRVRRPGPQRADRGRHGAGQRCRRRARLHVGLHLAEGADRGRHGAGDGRDDAARADPGRRGRRGPAGRVRDWQKALALPTVQGLVIGRSLLYPPGDDVATAVDTAVGLL